MLIAERGIEMIGPASSTWSPPDVSVIIYTYLWREARHFPFCKLALNKDVSAMKTSRIALFAFAAFVGISSLLGSARSSDAGGLGLDWLANKPYVECVKQARMLADVTSVMKGPVYREASYNRGRRECNQRYYGHP